MAGLLPRGSRSCAGSYKRGTIAPQARVFVTRYHVPAFEHK